MDPRHYNTAFTNAPLSQVPQDPQNSQPNPQPRPSSAQLQPQLQFNGQHQSLHAPVAQYANQHGYQQPFPTYAYMSYPYGTHLLLSPRNPQQLQQQHQLQPQPQSQVQFSAQLTQPQTAQINYPHLQQLIQPMTSIHNQMPQFMAYQTSMGTTFLASPAQHYSGNGTPINIHQRSVSGSPTPAPSSTFADVKFPIHTQVSANAASNLNQQDDQSELQNIYQSLLQAPPPPPPKEFAPNVLPNLERDSKVGIKNIVSSNNVQSYTTHQPSRAGADAESGPANQSHEENIKGVSECSNFNEILSQPWTKNLDPTNKANLDQYIEAWISTCKILEKARNNLDRARRNGMSAGDMRAAYERAIQVKGFAERQILDLKMSVMPSGSGEGPPQKKAKSVKNKPSTNEQKIEVQLCDMPDVKPTKEELERILNMVKSEATSSTQRDADERKNSGTEASSTIRPRNSIPSLNRPTIMNFVEDGPGDSRTEISRVPSACTTSDVANKSNEHDTSKDGDERNFQTATTSLRHCESTPCQDVDYRVASQDLSTVEDGGGAEEMDVVAISDSEGEENLVFFGPPTDPYLDGIDPDDRWMMEQMRNYAEKYNCRDRLVKALTMVRRRVNLIHGLNMMELQLQQHITE